MRKLLLAGVLLLANPASASVINNLDDKTKRFVNDGDGFIYIVSGKNKKSVEYSELFAFPLDSSLRLRYRDKADGTLESLSLAPGPKGVSTLRPLADLEILKLSALFTKLTDELAATGITLNPATANLGDGTGSFDVRDMKDAECKVKLYSQAIDICGTIFGRSGIVNYTMLDTRRCDGWGRYCAARIFKFDFGYKTASGRGAVQFYMTNERVAYDINQRLSSWLGSSFGLIK
jgi:hypothetical protein